MWTNTKLHFLLHPLLYFASILQLACLACIIKENSWLSEGNNCRLEDSRIRAKWVSPTTTHCGVGWSPPRPGSSHTLQPAPGGAMARSQHGSSSLQGQLACPTQSHAAAEVRFLINRASDQHKLRVRTGWEFSLFGFYLGDFAQVISPFYAFVSSSMKWGQLYFLTDLVVVSVKWQKTCKV